MKLSRRTFWLIVSGAVVILVAFFLIADYIAGGAAREVEKLGEQGQMCEIVPDLPDCP